MFRGLALGLSADTSDDSTDCYYSSDQVAININSIFAQLADYTGDNWMTPIEIGASALVELSNSLTACQAMTAIKQMDTRFSSWSGIMDLIVTVVMGFVLQSDIYTAYNALLASDSCKAIGLQTGQLIQFSLKYTSPAEVFYNAVSTTDYKNPNTAPSA